MADRQESLQRCYESGSAYSYTSFPPGLNGSSVFGESKLGEPLVAQHLVLDFTPKEDIDNDTAQRKCCAFWDYVKSRTDLRDMLVLPDEEIVTKVTDYSVTGSEFPPARISKQARTAVSMLEIVEGKGLIDRIFEAKLQQENCSLGSREYLRDESTKPAPSEITTCTCSKVCKLCRNVPKRSNGPPRGPSSPGVLALCQKLQTWDTEHPKSMNPPGHAPVLTHCVMQRRVIL